MRALVGRGGRKSRSGEGGKASSINADEREKKDASSLPANQARLEEEEGGGEVQSPNFFAPLLLSTAKGSV